MTGSADADRLSRGSMWRRWDPHVHLPGTLKNDQFGETTVEEALEDLAQATPEIEAVGITDYFTTRSFRRAYAAWQAGFGESIKFLFPNVELRLDIPTTKGSAVNLHLLCAPDQVDQLDALLGGLEFTFQDRTYRGDDVGLIALGKAFRGDPGLNADAARKEGAGQFKVNVEALRNKCQADSWAREHLLIAVAGSSTDGSSGVRDDDGGFVARRQTIERLANIVFSANPQQIRFWTGRGADSPEVLAKKYGGLKPCMHGSDAHKRDALGRPDGDRFTWAKGDPTFDTLRMTCLAPETRVYIGPASPASGTGPGRITSVAADGGDWFADGEVPINTGLVAIIGARGSGKTALADLIAAAAQSDQPFSNEASFVHRAGGLLSDITATVSWSEGDDTHRRLARGFGGDDGARPVRYLSQQFVEQLCASDGVSDELLTEIERVIFDAWPVDERQGASDFRDLLDVRLASARIREASELDTIESIGEAITDKRVLKQGLPAKRDEVLRQQQAENALATQIVALTAQSKGISGPRHGLVSAVLARRQDELQAVDRRLTDLRSLTDAAKLAADTRFPQLARTLQDQHRHVNLTEDQWAAFQPQFSGDVNVILTTARAAVEAQRQQILGTATAPSPPDGSAHPILPSNLDALDEAQLEARTVTQLRAEQARLQQLVGLDSQRAASLTKLQSQVAETRAKLARLQTEITEAEKADAQIGTLVEERVNHYEAYFSALLEEEQQLLELYQPLQAILSSYGRSVAKLRLSIKRRVDVDAWVEQGEQLVDLRRDGPFRGAGQLEKIVRNRLLAAWQTGSSAEAARAIKDFSQEYSDGIRRQSTVRRVDERAYREWERGVARWLYKLDHIGIAYSLEYDGIDVERLSPGTRGIVLLLLYLAVDQAESDPLIIDQPEENLDPESVYTELVSLFRSASDRRQIIMVTHNANLVVNTDVDQVIVAHCDQLEKGKLPRLRYEAGGLEDPVIRTAVCKVLEGGADAFRQRARRLGISGVVPSDFLGQ